MQNTNYLHITTDSFQLESIYQMETIQDINEHALLNITALLDSGQKESDIYTITEGSRIQIYNQLEQQFIFIGMIRNMSIKNVQEVYYLTIHAVSTTFLLDIKKQSRSFQNKNMGYQDIINIIMDSYEGGEVVTCQEAKESIENLIIQYNETDWEFLKRLASHFNKGLISSGIHKDPTLYFGEPKGTYCGEIENNNFSVKKNMDEYMQAKENGLPDSMEVDYITFKIEGNGVYNMGDYLDYHNMRLYVKSISAKFVRGEFIYTYLLSSKNGLKKCRQYNEKIIGASIKGKVLAIEKDLVKVHLSIDTKPQKEADSWQFQYSTSYTAEGNAGWYCMPEKGDTVLLYFPSKEEQEAIGMNSLREKNDLEKTSNPEIKYFRTANGKELKFAPDEIVITAVNHKNDVIYIRLNEEKGIEIRSSAPIHISSDEDINMDSQKKLKIHGDDEIVLQCKSSKITLNTEIELISKDVKIN